MLSYRNKQSQNVISLQRSQKNSPHKAIFVLSRIDGLQPFVTMQFIGNVAPGE